MLYDPTINRRPDSGLNSYRQALWGGGLALVEECYIAPGTVSPSGYESQYQIALPYHGLFNYMVGRKSWMIDPNRILFVTRGWEFKEDHPHPEIGHGAVLINFTAELLDEVVGCPARNSAFARGSRPPTARLKLLTHQILRPESRFYGPLWSDEWVVRTIKEAIDTPWPECKSPSKVVGRAKELLHASHAERLSLAEIAQRVGVAPTYLTHAFTRAEGMPLYRYQTHLRLSRALLELPHCDDITGLALDLGFSSHSHFTHVFRTVFGVTPSSYRMTGRFAGCDPSEAAKSLA